MEVVVGSKLDSIFLVFEYCSFELAQLVDTLPSAFPCEIKCVVKQLLEALACLHANGVMHRDLKLSNLLLSDEGNVCDFDSARGTHPAGVSASPRAHHAS